MIERVLVRGEDVDPALVPLSILIRHGRGSVDDGPLASTASLTVLEPTREQVVGFAAGDVLELLLAADAPRFVGRITDAKLTDAGLALLATSSLGRVATRLVGAVDWPEESWRSRIVRVLTEAEHVRTWAEASGTWDDAGLVDTWNVSPTSSIGWIDYGLEGYARFEWAVDPTSIGTEDVGPTIAARTAAETTAGAYLSGDFYASEPFAIANLPSGELIVQRLAYRAGEFSLGVPHKPELELDPGAVAFAPEFDQTDEVENSLELSWAGGTVTAQNAPSIERFGRRPARVGTELALEDDADTRAALRVHRRGFPRWQSAPIELLELREDLTIGSPVRLSSLPDWSPAAGFLGILEGWEDRVESDGAGGIAWSQRLFLSDPRLSGGFGITWGDTAETYLNAAYWSETGGILWSDPEDILLLLED